MEWTEPERLLCLGGRNLRLALLAMGIAPGLSRMPVSVVVVVPPVAAVAVVAKDTACRGASLSGAEEGEAAVFGWLELMQSHLITESLSSQSGIRSTRNSR